MSLYGALFSGVSGLASQSSAMGAISDNITNVNTTGYKGTKANFQTLVTKQVSLTTYSPGGVQSKPRAGIDNQGLLQATTSSTDLALSGQGMFVVNTDSDPAASGSGMFAYTRAGSFKVDKEGYLQNVSGFFLQGWPLKPTNNNVLAKPTEVTIDGNTYMKAYKQDDGTFHYVNQNIINPQELKSLNLKTIGGTADQTTQIKMGANLPSGDTIYNPASTSSSGYHQTSVLIYDSLGDTHNFNVNWTKTNSNQWDVETKSNFFSVSTTLTDIKVDTTAALSISGEANGNTNGGGTTLVTTASATALGYFAGTGAIAMPSGTLTSAQLPAGSVLTVSGATGTASTNNGDWYVSSGVATSPAVTDQAGTTATLVYGGTTMNFNNVTFTAAGSPHIALNASTITTYNSSNFNDGDYIKVSNGTSSTLNTGYYRIANKSATGFDLTPADYIVTSTAPYQDQRGVNPPSGAASMDILDQSNPSLVYASQGRMDFSASSAADVQAMHGKSFTVTVGNATLTVMFDARGVLSPGSGQEVIINLNNTNFTSGSDVATLVAKALRNPRNWDSTINANLSANLITAGSALPLFRANGSTVEIVQVSSGPTMKFNMSSMGTSVTQSQSRNWSAAIPSVDTVDGLFYVNTLTASTPAITFNGDGTPKTINVGKMAVNWANGAQSMTLVPNGTGADQRINWFVGNTSQADGMTQLGGTYQLAYLTQNGAKFGNFSGVSVGTDGVVTALFDNGVRRPVFQVPVATFTNPNGLEGLTGNTWIETNTSGTYTLRVANNAGAGSVQAASLEASTVDIGAEFTTMIVTQRAYSAAAKIITTADQMLDELVQIKR